MQGRLQIRRWQAAALPPNWFKRTKAANEKENAAVEASVKAIIAEVRNRGDAALVEFTEKFDKATLQAKNLRVSADETETAYSEVTEEQVSAIRLIKDKLGKMEKLTLQRVPLTESKSEGINVQTVVRPIQSVGCYVPGGQAVYPSTLVMTVVPAKVAGVPRVVVCSPPASDGRVNPLILVAADICGVDEVYKVGGVQAIAALAYGTETILPVKKIVGPGSKYVTTAKIEVSQVVAIDMPAGPSEVLVLADETANSKFVAADMVSQAEHGADSVAGLITTSETLAADVLSWIEKLVASAERKDMVHSSLTANGFIIKCKDSEEMAKLANMFAPEHLEIVARNAYEIAGKITSAGLILTGSYSPVALSDYGSGTNHVLPTGGFGGAFSGLSVLDFVRRVSVVESSQDGLARLRDHVRVLTEAEGLPNHYRAVEARFEE